MSQLMMFDYPFGLVLLLIVPLLIYLSWHTLSNISLLQKRILLSMRITVLVFLILGISGLAIKRKTDKVCTLFLLDISDSMIGPKIEDRIDIIENMVKLKRGKEQFGLVVFAGNASVEIAPTYNFNIKRITSVVDKSYTNIESAVDLAISIFPENTIKKIICITDGNQNQSDVIPKAIEARTKNITIDVISSGELARLKEVWIKDVITPHRVRLNQKFQIIVDSNTLHENTHGTLKIYKNGNFEGEVAVELKDLRENNVYFEQSLAEDGMCRFEFVLESNDDTYHENNIAGVMVYAGLKPKILYVYSDSPNAGLSTSIPFPESFVVDRVTPSFFLDEPDNIWQYDLVVFQDILANELDSASMEMLNHYVRDQGGGFIMLGGLKSLSPGGYSKTKIEEMLPVYLDPDPGTKGAGLNIVFAIDKSGSMAQKHGGKTKLRVVIDTLADVLKLLKKEDKLGIVLFDKLPGTVLPIQRYKSFQEIKSKLDSLEARGGTDIYKSLKTSFGLFKDSASKFKHIVLISDGQTGQADYSGLLKAMRGEKVTLSAIGIGGNVNESFLGSISERCGGRCYITQELDNLADIFKRETAMASRSWFREEEIIPRIFQPHEIIEGISAGSLPSLRGLIVTSTKSPNNDIVVYDKSTPILSAWQYGLGRTTILTTDVLSDWASNWLSWENFPRFWSQLVRWNTRSMDPGNWDIKTELNQGRIKITLETINEDGSFEDFLKLKAAIISPDNSEVAIDLDQTGPGKYEGFCPVKVRGFYVINLFYVEDENVAFKQSSGIFVSSLPEYMEFGTNWELLEKMCRLTGGSCYNRVRDLYGDGEETTLAVYSCMSILILAAVFLFIIEIAVRRLLFKT